MLDDVETVEGRLFGELTTLAVHGEIPSSCLGGEWNA